MSDDLKGRGAEAEGVGRGAQKSAVQAVRDALKLSEASTVMVIVCDGESLRVMGDEPDPWGMLDSLLSPEDDLDEVEAAEIAARAPRRLIN